MKASKWQRKAFGCVKLVLAQAKFEALVRFADGSDEFRESDAYQAEIQLFSDWIIGASFVELARTAPVYANKSSLFGGRDEPKRTSDATEHIGRLTYPASWAWSGAKVLAGELGDDLPGFIRNAIELGLPSEAATQLVTQARLTRSAALVVTEFTGPEWNSVLEVDGRVRRWPPRSWSDKTRSVRLASFMDNCVS